MSLQAYDNAMMEKLKSVFDNVIMAGSEESILKDASKLCGHDMVVRLPLISFIRTNNPLNMQHMNYQQIHSGRTLKHETTADKVKTLAINIMYQIDIRSDKRSEVDGIWRELCMYLMEKPEIDVKFDGFEELSSFPMEIMDTDNTTDVDNFGDIGRIWRQTISVEIQQAKLVFKESAGKLVREIPVRVVPVEDMTEIIR